MFLLYLGVLIIILTSGISVGFTLQQNTDNDTIIKGIKWSMTIFVLNLVNIGIVLWLSYYNTGIVGNSGRPGKRGERGNIGNSYVEYQCKLDPEKGVTLFEHCDFNGKHLELSEGRYKSLDINIAGFNKNISSIKVKKGFKVTLYQYDDFKGSSLILEKDANCLVNNVMKNNMNWNDVIESLVIEKKII